MATETFGCVWDDLCDYETTDWDALMEHSWTHTDMCRDGCGLDVDHDGPCRVRNGGRVLP